MLRKIEVVCDSVKSIPEKIDIDTSLIQVGQKIRASDLKLPAGVKLSGKPNALIASIIGRAKAEEEKPAAGAAAPAAGAATPAAGAKAPAAKADEKKPAAKK